jgi:hypothetical protein
MRTKSIPSLLVFCFFLLLAQNGCKQDSSNPAEPSNFSAKGADYLPISAGQIINARASGTATEYDSLGNVTSFSQINNQAYSGSVGPSTSIRSMNANPIFGNDKGKSRLLCYLANNNGEIDGFDNLINSQIAIALPSEITVGKEWVANPQSPANEQFKIKVIEALNSYTNSAGKSFQGVINLSVTCNNLIVDTTQYGSWYYKMAVDANIYLSKGIGIAEAKLNAYEEIYKLNYFSFPYAYYRKTKANGVIGFVD